MTNQNAHALLSASSSGRWMICTAAPRYEEQFPESTSAYAEHGRIVHEMAELKVLEKFTTSLSRRQYTDRLRKLKKKEAEYVEAHNASSPNNRLDTDGDRYSDVYLEHLTEQAMGYDTPPLVSAEVRVNFANYVPEGFGTCDCVMIGGDLLDITDYKHGKGVPVSAINNSQLRLYALGALTMYEPFYGGTIQKVRMTIIQPRVQDVPTSETLTVAELKEWGERLKPIAQLAYGGSGTFVPGEHCRFCRGKAQCRARANAHTALEDFKDHALPTPEITRANESGLLPGGSNVLTFAEIGDLLARGETLLAWFKDVQNFALTAILDGSEIPGWKAVAGRSNRAFTNQDEAIAAIIASGYDEALVYDRKPKTLTALEKLMGAKDFADKIGAFIHKPPGSPTLAPLSDKRSPYSSAASDFAEVAPPGEPPTPGATEP